LVPSSFPTGMVVRMTILALFIRGYAYSIITPFLMSTCLFAAIAAVIAIFIVLAFLEWFLSIWKYAFTSCEYNSSSLSHALTCLTTQKLKR
ncbi:MAG: hypothetical protein AAFP89_13285, partial [Bacteroidota bacterium]